MSEKTTKSFTYWLEVAAIGIMLGLILQGARAWTEPSVAPPGGNVGAPVNTSDKTQSKIGPLGINSAGVGNTLLIGLDVGGKAIADDFCTRSGKCLSTCSGETTPCWCSYPPPNGTSCMSAPFDGVNCYSNPQIGQRCNCWVSFVCGETTYICTPGGWTT